MPVFFQIETLFRLDLWDRTSRELRNGRRHALFGESDGGKRVVDQLRVRPVNAQQCWTHSQVCWAHADVCAHQEQQCWTHSEVLGILGCVLDTWSVCVQEERESDRGEHVIDQPRVRLAHGFGVLSAGNKYGTYETVNARFWPVLAGPKSLKPFDLFLPPSTVAM